MSSFENGTAPCHPIHVSSSPTATPNSCDGISPAPPGWITSTSPSAPTVASLEDQPKPQQIRERRLSVVERLGFVAPKYLSEDEANPRNLECEGRNSCNSNNNGLLQNKDSGEYKGVKIYLGLLLTFAGGFCFSLLTLFGMLLKDYGFDGYGTSFWSYMGIVVPTIPVLLFYECGPGVKKKDSVFSGVWPMFGNGNWKTWLWLLSRGLLGSVSLILRYYTLQYMTIADRSVMTYATPLLVFVLAYFVLKERCGVFSIFAAFVSMGGGMIIAKPPLFAGDQGFDPDFLIGTGFAFGSSLCAALIIILTRKLHTIHSTVMMLVFGIIDVAQALILIYFMDLGELNLPIGLYDTLLLIGVCSVSFLGQLAIILALKSEQAGPVALTRSCDILFGFIIQLVFLGVAPDIFSVIGGVMVFSCVLSNGFQKWLKTLPPQNKQRKRWWFVLK